MDEADSTAPAPRHRLAVGIGLAVLAVLLTVLLLPAFKAPLIFDDNMSLTQVETFKSWTDALGRDVFSLFRPVKNLFFYLMHQAGASAVTYHGVTLVAYFVATLGVFTLTRRLTLSPLWGLAAAAIWSLSAAHVSTAIWPSALNISVAAAAMTFGLSLWDRWRETPGRLLDGIGFFLLLVLGLCSYETAVALAPMVVMFDLFRGRRIFSKGSLARYAGIAVVVLAWLAIRHGNEASTARLDNPSFTDEIETWQIAASAPYFLWTHFLMWLAPWGRIEFLGSYLWDQSIPAVIIPFCWLMLVGIAVLCARFWKPGNLFVLGLAWFFLAAFPSGNFIPLGNTPYADYYVPIPAIGLTIATIAVLRGLLRLSRKPGLDASARRFALVLVGLIVAARAANVVELRIWANSWEKPAVMMARTAAARPHQYLAKITVARIMYNNGNKEIAEEHARSAIEDTQLISMPYIVLGQVHYDREEYDDALEMMLAARDKRHVYHESPYLIDLYIGRIIGRDPERTDEAFHYFLTVLKRQHSDFHVDAVISAAEMFGEHGNSEMQRIQLERGLEVHPDHPRLVEALEALDPGADE